MKISKNPFEIVLLFKSVAAARQSAAKKTGILQASFILKVVPSQASFPNLSEAALFF